jgi:hypothetical protein
MSNKTQLQANNEKYASLIEVLKTKGTPSGEEVTEETNAYTAKLETLETAITALENELEGKASGGSGTNGQSAMVTFNGMYNTKFYYIEGSNMQVIENPNQEYAVDIPSLCVAYNPLGYQALSVFSGDASIIAQSGTVAAFLITGQATIVAVGNYVYEES